MTVVSNIAHRNAILNALGAVYNSGTVEIWSGTPPGPDNAATGTLLATVTVPATAFAAASAGSMSKTGTWTGSASAAGTPGYFRLKNSGGTQIREGTAGTAGTDMILTGLVSGATVVGATVTVSAYTISQPAS